MRKILILTITAMVMVGCNINKDLLFKTPTNYEYDTLSDSSRVLTYRISIDDLIDFRLFSNDGFKLIDLGNSNTDNRNLLSRQNQPLYLVDEDGTIKLPTIGRTKITGMTIREAESMLEEKYAEFYVKPFVLLSVRNNRVIVSPGMGGAAKVVNLENKNTTLLEVLAQAGGISPRGNASKVKLIRLDQDGSRLVYDLDLSTIEGLRDADIIVQANDIVYVEPMPQLAVELVQNLGPYVTLLTSVVLVLGILNFR